MNLDWKDILEKLENLFRKKVEGYSQSVDNFIFAFSLYSVVFYDFSTTLKLVIQKSIHKIKNTYLSYKICAKISN